MYATRLCGPAELRQIAVAVPLRTVRAGNVRPVRAASVCPVCAAEDVCAGNVRAQDVRPVFAENLRAHDVCAENLRPACSEDVRAEDLCAAAVLRPLCRLPAGRLCCAAEPAVGPRDGAGRGARGAGA